MMKKEHSFGILPIKQENGKWYTLLVKHQKGHWAFPKGHPEPHETPKQTAQRELYEETALQIDRFLDVDPLVEQYSFSIADGMIEKHVTYFIAEVEGEVRVQDEEIETFQWIALEDAEELATFPESKQLCQTLATYIL